MTKQGCRDSRTCSRPLAASSGRCEARPEAQIERAPWALAVSSGAQRGLREGGRTAAVFSLGLATPMHRLDHLGQGTATHVSLASAAESCTGISLFAPLRCSAAVLQMASAWAPFGAP